MAMWDQRIDNVHDEADRHGVYVLYTVFTRSRQRVESPRSIRRLTIKPNVWPIWAAKIYFAIIARSIPTVAKWSQF